jgi:hypothetical protein
MDKPISSYWKIPRVIVHAELDILDSTVKSMKAFVDQFKDHPDATLLTDYEIYDDCIQSNDICLVSINPLFAIAKQDYEDDMAAYNAYLKAQEPYLIEKEIKALQEKLKEYKNNNQ